MTFLFTLWTLKKNSERVDFLIRNRNFDFESEKPRKNDAFAKELRNKAKEILAMGKYEEAEFGFTWSLAFAETSKSMALSYACRASALINMKRYQEALLDIDRSFKAGCREDLKANLLSGRKLCEEKEQLLIEGPPPIPDCEQHPLIECAKNCIDIRKNEQFGKHIVANRDIEIGEILAVDKPFSVTIVSTGDCNYEYCSECGKRSHNLIPCDYCVVTMYCSDTCKNKAEDYHKYECLVQHSFSGNISACKKILKTTLLSFCGPNNELNSDNKYRSDRYKEVYELTTHLDKVKIERLYLATLAASIIFLSIKYHTTFFRDFSNLSNVEELFKERLVHNFGVHDVNDVNLGFNPLDISATYSLFSLFNHSCSPNVDFTSHDNKMILRAIRTINKGEQCFINYKNCIACSENWKFPLIGRNKKYGDAIKELQKNDVNFAKRLLPKLYAEIKRLEKLEPCTELIFVDDLVSKCYQLLAGKGYIASNLNRRLGLGL